MLIIFKVKIPIRSRRKSNISNTFHESYVVKHIKLWHSAEFIKMYMCRCLGYHVFAVGMLIFNVFPVPFYLVHFLIIFILYFIYLYCIIIYDLKIFSLVEGVIIFWKSQRLILFMFGFVYNLQGHTSNKHRLGYTSDFLFRLDLE